MRSGFVTSDPHCSGKLQNGLSEAMANSPLVEGWTNEQWEQTLINTNQLDLEDLEEVRVNALERAKACAKSAMAKGRAAAKEWAAAATSQGAKLAHRWTARIGAKPQLAEEVINGASHFFAPLDMMASRFNTWAAKWQKHTRGKPRGCGSNAGSQDLRKGKPGTAQDHAQGSGVCSCHDERGDWDGGRPIWPAFHQELVDRKIVDLVNECEERVAWLWQVFITLVC